MSSTPSTIPGPIKWVAHDPQQAVDPTGMYAYIDGYVSANSYGRNNIAGELLDDAANLGGGLAVWTDPDRIDYTVNSPPVVGTWDPYVMLHESMHTLKIGEGAAKDAITGYEDRYGDKYSIMGRQGASGHLPAFYKERIGWIGAPDSLRGLLEVTADGIYPITDIESASAGNKALKIILNRYTLYRSDMRVYQDKIEYWYLEMRKNHTFITSSTLGKGHKRRVSTTYTSAPGVQFRTGIPGYVGMGIGYDSNVQGYLRLDVGYMGGLQKGQSYYYKQDLQSQVTYDGVLEHIYRPVAITIAELTTDGASITVKFG